MNDAFKLIKQAADKLNISPEKYDSSESLGKAISVSVKNGDIEFKRLMDMPEEIKIFARKCFDDDNEITAKIIQSKEDIENIKADVIYVSGTREVLKLNPNAASRAVTDNFLKKLKGSYTDNPTIYFPKGSYLKTDILGMGYNFGFSDSKNKKHLRKGSSRPISFKIEPKDRYILTLVHKKEKAMDKDMVDVLGDFGI